MNKITLVDYHNDEINALLGCFGRLTSGKFRELDAAPSEKACMDLIDESERLLIAATDGAYSAVSDQSPTDGGSALETLLLAKHSQTLTYMRKSITSMRKSADAGKYEDMIITANRTYPKIMEFFTAMGISIPAPSQPENGSDETDEMEQILNSPT